MPNDSVPSDPVSAVSDPAALAFESAVVRTYSTAVGAPLTLADESAITKTIVRAAADSPAASGLGVSFGSSRRAGSTLVLGQRPGEYMLIGTAASNASIVDQLDTSGHVSVIDHTHSRVLFRMTGTAASSALEKVCSMDWSDEMTPDGAVVSASVAKVNCDIVRHDTGGQPSYRIACDRSFGQYLFDALIDAGNEFDIAVAS